MTPSAGLPARFDEALYSFLAARSRALPEASELISIIEGVLASGGKRLRPSFCYWGFRAAGGSHGSEIVNTAAALELLHTFAIVHDDIMDSSELRRGKPAVHAVHGSDVALLVGDLALVLADELIAASGFPPGVLAPAFSAYSRMRQEVIAGQYLDLAAAKRGDVTVEQARTVARLKSGRYTVVEPLVIGALLAGGGSDLTDGLATFGEPLGEAFQLRDDVLGIFGREDVTGKPADADLLQGKRHVLYAQTVGALEGSDRARFLQLWGDAELDPSATDWLRSAVRDSGALATTERLIADLTQQADAALERLEIDDEVRQELRDLAERVVRRDY